MWSLASGELVNTFEGHSREVSSVVISPDGTKVISGSYDNTIKVFLSFFEVFSVKNRRHQNIPSPFQCWSLASGQIVNTFEGHTNCVNAVAISADGKTVVSASDDKTIKVILNFLSFRGLWREKAISQNMLSHMISAGQSIPAIVSSQEKVFRTSTISLIFMAMNVVVV